MSPIPQLVALSALVYAVLLLFVVLQFRTPQLAELSARLYRLLLAAYPAAFRREYGGAMAQLFRDMARDGYRRRGLFGLSAVWGPALADLVANVFRQHRQEMETGLGEEAMSGQQLLQRWFFLGGTALSVTVLSAQYTLYLVRRRPLRTWAVVSAITFVLWSWSFYQHLGIITLWEGTDLDIRNGSMELRHIYDHTELISLNRWLGPDNPFRSKSPLSTPMPWEFSFSSGHVMGYGGGLGYIRPCFYWRLRIPLLLIPMLLLCWALLARPRDNSLSGPAMQSA